MTGTVIVTGGSGFIGSNFVRMVRQRDLAAVVNLDKLTYAGNPDNLSALADDGEYIFVHGDIGDAVLTGALLREHRPRALVHFAAESHVDRSIEGPAPFIETNVTGTCTLLESVRLYLEECSPSDREIFRFIHVSTDEVYGDLGREDPPFTERTPYAPSSPYAASKAASDHLVRAWRRTYGLPAIITNCSNNYGPRQFPEKLIPLMILSAREGKHLPVYGDGLQVRDWLYVDDHCEAILAVLEKGVPGETYNIGGDCERTNLQIVKGICAALDGLFPDAPHRPHEELITFVTDRPGHDRRYAMDITKIGAELGWKPKENLESGLARTVSWYLENSEWVEKIRSGAYREWLDCNYGDRLKNRSQEA